MQWLGSPVAHVCSLVGLRASFFGWGVNRKKPRYPSETPICLLFFWGGGGGGGGGFPSPPVAVLG